ncbi:glycoside hydrolase family 25 protein [Erythrobacter sp. BLCC-B19]|uniref:glycoside hydrolase family 25 protein n=1 Tax=Erythrobacter sp. BLCC-B19 TaxID=3025315 RepID=UPI00235ED98A|nr:glycoside hydrolase family 25 protein [Erythrobacter sp. BLCC-B19]WDA41800.1 glycoside hydrolase family 25 protein [Erythrobacter sp. BLCC-B19]
MARGRKSGARRASRRWLLRLAAVVVLVGLAFAAWLWWDMRSWHPDEAAYPEQGALVPAGGGEVRFATLKAIGARFVYLPLVGGPAPGAPGGFADRFAAARAAGLQVGVVLDFDPCAGADAQSGMFAQMVPRDAKLLPPAISLARLADGCDPKVSDAAAESELMTLINQIEIHAGKPAILKLSPAFQARHNTANALARDLWLARDRARPDYAGRPWLLWSANSARVTEASAEPVEWVVVQK